MLVVARSVPDVIEHHVVLRLARLRPVAEPIQIFR